MPVAQIANNCCRCGSEHSRAFECSHDGRTKCSVFFNTHEEVGDHITILKDSIQVPHGVCPCVPKSHSHSATPRSPLQRAPPSRCPHRPSAGPKPQARRDRLGPEKCPNAKRSGNTTKRSWISDLMSNAKRSCQNMTLKHHLE